MKNLICSIIGVLFLSFNSYGQGIPDENPNNQWRFVRSNEVTLITEQLSTYEFPAFKQNKYIVNLEMKSDTVDIDLYIYTMQSELIAELSSTRTRTGQLEFTVDHNATYQIMVKVKAPDATGEIKQVETLMSLLKKGKS